MLLLDTNIVGYFFRRDTRAALYERHLVGHPLGISFATLAELYQWLKLRPFTVANRDALLRHIAKHTVIPWDDQMAWVWAELTAECRRQGIGMTTHDAWIAATALRHDLPLVTHNRKHFEHLPGLTIISES